MHALSPHHTAQGWCAVGMLTGWEMAQGHQWKVPLQDTYRHHQGDAWQGTPLHLSSASLLTSKVSHLLPVTSLYIPLNHACLQHFHLWSSSSTLTWMVFLLISCFSFIFFSVCLISSTSLPSPVLFSSIFLFIPFVTFPTDDRTASASDLVTVLLINISPCTGKSAQLNTQETVFLTERDQISVGIKKAIC